MGYERLRSPHFIRSVMEVCSLLSALQKQVVGKMNVTCITAERRRVQIVVSTLFAWAIYLTFNYSLLLV